MNRETRGLFFFRLIDELFPNDGESAEQESAVSDRLFYRLLISAALITTLLGVLRWVG
jgi:hypothetical protein